jgi:hypothetical protein
VCSEQRLVVKLEGTEVDWPQLAHILSEFGRTEGFEVYDTSVSNPGYIRTLGVSVCSAAGLYLSVDDRVYEDPRLKADLDSIQDLDSILVVLNTYNNAFEWKPAAERFATRVRESWKGKVSIRWPEPLGEKNRFLPDSVATCEASGEV